MMEEDGIVKFVVDKKYGEILGVHILGPKATELIGMASVAMKNELRWRCEFPHIFHPSLSEVVEEAVWDLKSKPSTPRETGNSG
jgi:dihydrolipoamide dehydrogenase